MNTSTVRVMPASMAAKLKETQAADADPIGRPLDVSGLDSTEQAFANLNLSDAESADLPSLAVDFATRAAELIGGARESSHGNKTENFDKTALLWTVYLKIRRNPNGRLSAEDFANMMELMKIARRCSGDFNPDDYIDGAGYAACAGEVASLAKAAATDSKK